MTARFLWIRDFESSQIPRQRLRGGRISERRVFKDKKVKDDQLAIFKNTTKGQLVHTRKHALLYWSIMNSSQDIF